MPIKGVDFYVCSILLGSKEAVERAKITVKACVKEFENITEDSMSVNPSHHKHFVARGGEVLRRIGDEFGGIDISFPFAGDKVILKGARNCIDAAITKINEIVQDLEDVVSINIEHKSNRL